MLLGGTQDQARTVIFGFYKPSSIFRMILLSVSPAATSLISHATCWSRFTTTETIKFLIVGQACFQILNDSVDLFNEALREKNADPTEKAETDARDVESPYSDDNEEDGTYDAEVESDNDNEAEDKKKKNEE